ncbi:MAG TPA: ABC transporter permease subunit [Vicinamibacterales bacterium]|nr:ABC transporter permease subunit [Vicinamibacterales bacterium]HPW21959.1 ABC transporter permease subunit [Vicinamibacterales bacterium]
MRVLDLSLGQMLWSRRTIFLALVVGSPLALGLLFRILSAFGVSGAMRAGGVAMGGPAIFGSMVWLLYLRFIVPVLGVFYGTALIADEVEDKTVTYLFVRPIPRSAVLVGKYLAYLVTTACVVLPSVVLLYLLVAPLGNGSLAGAFPALVKDLALLGIGLAAYGALFAFIGARFKHPLVTGLVFAFGWEQVALMLPGYLRRVTIAYYLQSLVPHSMPAGGLGSALQSLFRDAPPVWVSLAWLAGCVVVFLALAARATGCREYVLDQ